MITSRHQRAGQALEVKSADNSFPNVVRLVNYNKDIQIPSKHNTIYYTLPLLDYMFRLLRVIIRPSSELTQDYLIPSALWDPVALTVVGAIVL